MAGTSEKYTSFFSTEFTAESIEVDMTRHTKEKWYGGNRYKPDHIIEDGFIDYTIHVPYHSFDGVETKGSHRFKVTIEEVD